MGMTSELVKKAGSDQAKKPEANQRMALGSQASTQPKKNAGCCY